MKNLPILSTIHKDKAQAIADAINRWSEMEDMLGRAVVINSVNFYHIDIIPEPPDDIEHDYLFMAIGARMMYDILKERS